MVTVEELVVKATPEGISEVEDGLEGMEEKAEETAESMEEQSKALGDISNKFAGAMGAITAGFAVVAGGLLSRVPVLGEAMSGLGAILDVVGMKIDQTLRPVLQPLTDLFFKIANAIGETDGPLGTLIGLFASVVAVGSAIASVVLGAVGTFLAFGGSLSTVIGIGSTLIGIIGSIASAIISLPALLVAAVAAIAAFAVAYITNWRGTRDKTDAIIGEIIQFVKNGFNTLVEKAKNLLGEFVSVVGQFGRDVMTTLSDKLGGVADIAFNLGKKFILSLLSGIESFAQLIVDSLTNILNANIQTINTILDKLPDSVSSKLSIDTVDKIESPSISAGVNAGASAAQNFIGRSGTRDTPIYLDGQRVDDNQGRYRKSSLTRRGI